MIFRQLTHDDLGCASYLIGDDNARVAAVVDPRYEIDAYLELARYLRVRIEHILETHTHADHVSGHGRLAAATGARIHIHRDAGVAYDHEPFDDGWELELGAVRARAVHTPGHRPEHTAFVLFDTARGDEPWAVLTGDTLFVGDIARPDLAIDREAGARGIFHSLHDALLTLPAGTEVWPGHLGGSMCGGPGMDLKVSSTIGFERAHNELLAVADEDEFVRRALATLGPQPPNFEAIVELNRGPLVADAVAAPPLAPRQVAERLAEGAILIDLRTDRQFDDAHIPGALSASMLHPGFGTKLAWLADPDRDIVFVGRDDADGRHAAGLAAAVGVRRVAGVLAGGMTGWRDERGDVQCIERIDVAELHERAAEGAVQILDVRSELEWRDERIAGAAHVPYHDVRGVPDELDAGRPIAVICASGERSAVAASILQARGAAEVLHVVDGGVGTWGRLGHPLERG